MLISEHPTLSAAEKAALIQLAGGDFEPDASDRTLADYTATAELLKGAYDSEERGAGTPRWADEPFV